MCLEIKKTDVMLRAESDMVCYKVVEYFELTDKYKTYFKKAVIELGATYESELERYKTRDKYLDIVEKGLHSFKKLNDVKKWVVNCVFNYKDLKIIRCVIPKGSSYYFGSFGYYDSYCSSALKYLEIENL